jgi:branched-chain amino acid transport system permease protein
MIRHNWKKAAGYLAVTVFCLLLPLITQDPYCLHILIMVFTFSVVALAWRLIMITGQLSFGQASFMAIGAFTSTLLVMNLGVSFWLAMPLAGLVAAAFAALLGYPILGVKDAAFAILTLAWGEVVRQILINLPPMIGRPELFGGHSGIPNVPPPDPIHIPGLLTIAFTSKTSYYYLILCILLITAVVMHRLDRSFLGRVFRSIEQSDTLAESLGINTLRYKVMAFTIACFFTGISGSFFVHYYSLAHPDTFTLSTSVSIVTYALVGGMGSIAGPVLGCFVLTTLIEILRSAEAYQMVSYALILIGVILFLPGGLLSLPRAVAIWTSRHREKGGTSGDRKWFPLSRPLIQVTAQERKD